LAGYRSRPSYPTEKKLLLLLLGSLLSRLGSSFLLLGHASSSELKLGEIPLPIVVELLVALKVTHKA
jgi:hypothetical protein